MRNIQNRFWLSPEDDGGGPEMGLEDILEDGVEGEAPEGEEQPEAPQTVASASLDDAIETLRAAGFEAVPQSMVSPQQQEVATQAVDYASHIQVPPEVSDLGFDAEMRYIASESARMATEAAMAPMVSQQTATAIASQQNRPELAPQIQAAMEQAAGPNWYNLLNNPQTAGAAQLMIQGVMSSQAKAVKDAAPIPRQEGVGRKAQTNLPAGMSALDAQRLSEIAKETGMSVEDLIS